MDIGTTELLLIAVVALLVIGPERLPETLRTLGLWFGRLRRSFLSVKTEIEKEIGMDDIRRQLHNESVMEEMRRIEEEVKSSVDPAISLNEGPPLYSDTDNEPPATSESPLEPEPAPPLPRSEAELEAMHAARQKQAAREDKRGDDIEQASLDKEQASLKEADSS